VGASPEYPTAGLYGPGVVFPATGSTSIRPRVSAAAQSSALVCYPAFRSERPRLRRVFCEKGDCHTIPAFFATHLLEDGHTSWGHRDVSRRYLHNYTTPSPELVPAAVRSPSGPDFFPSDEPGSPCSATQIAKHRRWRHGGPPCASPKQISAYRFRGRRALHCTPLSVHRFTRFQVDKVRRITSGLRTSNDAFACVILFPPCSSI